MKGGIQSLETSKRHLKQTHIKMIRHKMYVESPWHHEEEDERKDSSEESLESESEEEEEKEGTTVQKRINQIKEYWKKQKNWN